MAEIELITLQQAPVIDGLSEDGTPRHQLPYPFHVARDGRIAQQGFWRGTVYQVIGFQDHPAVQKLALLWYEVEAFPELAVGKYLVTADDQGNWGSWPTAVETAERITVDESFMDA